MTDFTPVWKALSSSHVLLLIDTHLDPSKPLDGGYDLDFFDSKVEEIHDWFKSIVKDRYGKTDFKLKNGAWLCIRPLLPVPVPINPQDNLKVMVLR